MTPDTCESYEHLLIEYADDELAPQDAAGLLDHLAGDHVRLHRLTARTTCDPIPHNIRGGAFRLLEVQNKYDCVGSPRPATPWPARTASIHRGRVSPP